MIIIENTLQVRDYGGSQSKHMYDKIPKKKKKLGFDPP